MYYLNKIVGAILNPLGIGLLLVLLSALLAVPLASASRRERRRYGLAALPLVAFAWLWFWSTGVVGRWIGLSLEREFPPQLAEQMPTADAIVVLGGGVGLNTNACPYAKLFLSADRAWHGARLYRHGKAPKVFVTCEADALFMVDLGVPRDVITVNDKARNTEEEASGFRFQVSSFRGKVSGFKSQVSTTEPETCDLKPELIRPKILLVTSAWHMRRAKLMYERYAKSVEVIPAATDYVNTTMFDKPLEFKDFVPDPVMIGQNAYMFKEWLAYYGYKWLR